MKFTNPLIAAAASGILGAFCGCSHDHGQARVQGPERVQRSGRLQDCVTFCAQTPRA
jgi:hypothetical protein